MQSGTRRPRIGGAVELMIPAADLPRLNPVLHDFYECYSGGRQWTGLSDDDRLVFARRAAQLPERHAVID